MSRHDLQLTAIAGTARLEGLVRGGGIFIMRGKLD
jgi:hypothetical protein